VKILYITIVIITLAVIACSPTKRYEVLNFVFDGVPDPNLADSIARQDSLRLLADNTQDDIAFNLPVSKTVMHPPYKERQCDICHKENSFGELNQSPPDLCYNCHESFSSQYQFVHGPVEAGFCTACHSPHNSKNEKLLTRTGQEICLKCHNKEDVLKNEVHEGIEETYCTECHNPHGGEDRYIFR